MKHILSLGAGVQSSTMALMAAKSEITPMPDAAIFSDVGAEPQSVYDYLDWLENELPFPVYRVMEKDGLLVDLEKGISGKRCSNPPLFTKSSEGKKGMLMRTCTVDFKIRPINRKAKEIVGWKGRKPKQVECMMWIGISKDEIQRMKESREPWIEHRFPLIDMDMRRDQCVKWMVDNGYPKPPRSACWFCPYHSNKEWRRLRDEEPEEFAKAIELDKRIRDGVYTVENQLFLHVDRVPLDEVDLRSSEEKGQRSFDFMSECDGMCGV